MRDAFQNGGRLFSTAVLARAAAWACSTPANARPPSASTRSRCRASSPVANRRCTARSRAPRTTPDAGAEAVRFRGVRKKDVFIGIAASGRTPFVWGGIWEANRRGAKTALLCFNPTLKIPRDNRPGAVIKPDLGPELLTGSTRLKSGTRHQTDPEHDHHAGDGQERQRHRQLDDRPRPPATPSCATGQCASSANSPTPPRPKPGALSSKRSGTSKKPPPACPSGNLRGSVLECGRLGQLALPFPQKRPGVFARPFAL